MNDICSTHYYVIKGDYPLKRIPIIDLKLLEILNRIPFFNKFTVNEREVFLAGSLTFLHCRANENIIKEGDSSTDFYIMLVGSADVLVNFSQDKVAEVKAGYFLGEGAFIMNRPHSATIKATSEVFVLRLDQSTLRRFPASVREKVKDQIIDGMAVRLADMNEKQIIRDVHK
jgi:CRP/FNR family cyclic AMP-dependent transcriptional regulator